MNGFAGLHLAKKRRREAFVLRKHSQNLRAECVVLVVGLVVSTVEKLKASFYFLASTFSLRESSLRVRSLMIKEDLKKSRYLSSRFFASLKKAYSRSRIKGAS